MSCLDTALALNTSLMVFVNASFSQTPIVEGSDFQLNIMNNIWLCKSVAGVRKRRECTDNKWLVHHPYFDSSVHHTSTMACRHNSLHNIGAGMLIPVLTKELDKPSHVWLSHWFQTYVMRRGAFSQLLLQSVRDLCLSVSIFLCKKVLHKLVFSQGVETLWFNRTVLRWILRSKHQTPASDLVPAVTLARSD